MTTLDHDVREHSTDLVVAGDEPGSKYDKARELGITIVAENEFLKRAQT